MRAQHEKTICILMPVHWTHAMGGAEYQIKCIIDLLKRSGQYKVFVLTRHVNPSYKPNGYKIVKIRNLFGFSRGRYILDGPSLLNALRKISPDVIYQRFGVAYTGFAAWYARHYGSKFVWHVAHDDDVTPLSSHGVTKATGGGFVERKLIEYGIHNAHDIIAQTTEQAQCLERYYHRKPSAVLGNFHPIPTEHIEKSNPVNVVWVANIKPMKQPEIFLRLAEDIGVSRDVKFIMVGALSSSRWARGLKKEIDNAAHVSYLGRLTQDEVNQLLARSHILVNTSEREGFSNTFIQAWMRKMPVVSLTVNPNNLFEDQKIGLCSGDYQHLKNDVLMLIEDRERWGRMGSEAQQYAFEKHSEKEGKKLLAFL
ncbi:MAG: glycosyltransferase family 4 protein [Thiohalomonadales bacterium]